MDLSGPATKFRLVYTIFRHTNHTKNGPTYREPPSHVCTGHMFVGESSLAGNTHMCSSPVCSEWPVETKITPRQSRLQYKGEITKQRLRNASCQWALINTSKKHVGKLLHSPLQLSLCWTRNFMVCSKNWRIVTQNTSAEIILWHLKCPITVSIQPMNLPFCCNYPEFMWTSRGLPFLKTQKCNLFWLRLHYSTLELHLVWPRKVLVVRG